jgi:hypothetical protein
MPAFPGLTSSERTEVVAYLVGDKPTPSSQADPDE